MTAEEQKRYINYLAERVREADLGLRARDAVLQDFLDEKKILVERLSKLDAVLSDVEELKKSLASEVKKRKATERKVDDLKAKLKFANKNLASVIRVIEPRKRIQMKSLTVSKTRMILPEIPLFFCVFIV